MTDTVALRFCFIGFPAAIAAVYWLFSPSENPKPASAARVGPRAGRRVRGRKRGFRHSGASSEALGWSLRGAAFAEAAAFDHLASDSPYEELAGANDDRAQDLFDSGQADGLSLSLTESFSGGQLGPSGVWDSIPSDVTYDSDWSATNDGNSDSWSTDTTSTSSWD